MATAPLTYVAGPDPETLKANQAYQDALTRLTESLEGRKNRMFDPQLLALAEGLLTPGRTGSFFEGLGTAAGKMRQAEELEEKRAQEIAQAQLGLAEKGLSLAQMRQREKMYRELLGGQPGELLSGAPAGAAPSAPSAPATRPTALQEGTPQAEFARVENPNIPPPGMTGPNVKFIQISQPTGTMLSERGFLLQSMLEGKPVSDAMDKARQFNKDRYQFRDNRVYDSATGRLYFYDTGETVKIATSQGEMSVPRAVAMEGKAAVEAWVKGLPSPAELAGKEAGAKALAERQVSPDTVDRFIPGMGNQSLPKDLAARYDEAAAKFGRNSSQAMQVVAPYLGTSKAGEAGGTAPDGQPVQPTTLGVPSKQEQETAQRVANLTAEDRAKYENEKRREVLDNSDRATPNMSRAMIFRQYADAPDAKDMFGIFSNNEVRSLVARLVEQGVGVTGPGGRFAVGIPEFQTIVRNLRLNPQQQAKFQVALQLMTESQIMMSQYTKGAVSNYEQQLFGRAGINPEDVPGSMRMKADMITLRGQFDKDIAAKFEESNQGIREFKRSDWYKNRLRQYDEDLSKIANGNRLVPRASGIPRYNPQTKTWE